MFFYLIFIKLLKFFKIRTFLPQHPRFYRLLLVVSSLSMKTHLLNYIIKVEVLSKVQRMPRKSR
jgi:hypothetical protein